MNDVQGDFHGFKSEQFFQYFQQTACPVPPLYGFDEEEDLDVTPLKHYWLLIKFIMVCPGDIDLFEVQKCSKDGVVYIKDKNGVHDVGTVQKRQ